MSLMHEPVFWILTAACMAISSIPSMMRTIRKMRIILIAMLWLGICGATYMLFGALPAIISAVASVVWGTLLLIASLILSGLKSMPNNRFENR